MRLLLDESSLASKQKSTCHQTTEVGRKWLNTQPFGRNSKRSVAEKRGGREDGPARGWDFFPRRRSGKKSQPSEGPSSRPPFLSATDPCFHLQQTRMLFSLNSTTSLFPLSFCFKYRQNRPKKAKIWTPGFFGPTLSDARSGLVAFVSKL